MLHRGEFIKNKISEIGISLSELSRRLNISRKTMYNWFEDDDLPIEHVLSIGKVVNIDFRTEFPDIFKNGVEEPINQYGTNWREKYFALLEENHQISKKYVDLMDKKLKEYALSLI